MSFLWKKQSWNIKKFMKKIKYILQERKENETERYILFTKIYKSSFTKN